MIFDSLTHAEGYRGLGAGFAQAFDYLRTTDLYALPTGRVEIAGDGLFAIVVDEPTRARSDCRWEAHRAYCDLQLVVIGQEVMGYAPLASMKLVEPFADGGDYAFYEGDGQYVTVDAGQFTVFAPQDVHRPSIAVNHPARVRKVVLKIQVQKEAAA